MSAIIQEVFTDMAKKGKPGAVEFFAMRQKWRRMLSAQRNKDMGGEGLDVEEDDSEFEAERPPRQTTECVYQHPSYW